MAWTTLAYAIGFIFAGWFIDRVGTRIGYSVYLTVWSIMAAAHAFVSSAIGFAMARFGLGIGESGNFPAAIKTVAEWFPKKERAFATGIFNAATSVGAIAAPFVIGAIVYWSGGSRGEGEDRQHAAKSDAPSLVLADGEDRRAIDGRESLGYVGRGIESAFFEDDGN